MLPPKGVIPLITDQVEAHVTSLIVGSGVLQQLITTIEREAFGSFGPWTYFSGVLQHTDNELD